MVPIRRRKCMEKVRHSINEGNLVGWNGDLKVEKILLELLLFSSSPKTWPWKREEW